MSTLPCLRWFAVFLAIGCGTDDSGPSDSSLDATTTTDGSPGQDGAGDASVADGADVGDGTTITPLDAWFEGYNLVDGGTLPDGASCGNPNWFKFGIVETCCNGEVCEGLPDGATRCNCFGLVDGCAFLGDAAACCFDSRGCGSRNLCAKGL